MPSINNRRHRIPQKHPSQVTPSAEPRREIPNPDEDVVK